MQSIKKVFRRKTVLQLLNLIILIAAIMISFIFKKNKKFQDIWLIAERNNEARDNGYHLFKFIRTNYPSINVYYVINKNAIDKNKVIKFGNVINFGSLKHYLYYALSKKLISTHIKGPMPDPVVCSLLNKYYSMAKKTAFLQHGIIKDFHPLLSYEKARLDLFVCGAKPEYEFVKNHFGYVNNEVQYLGLARFDNLHNAPTKKQVLLMPTFRMWLATDTQKKTAKDCESFSNSDYYKTYQSFLNNTQIADTLKKNNTTLIFYPHYEIQGYLHLFSTISENIVIANGEDYDVQHLLKDSSLLITDYSSVYFDFAYMKKPVIYYHFDYEEFRGGHYEEGYFDYKNHGFGPIVQTEDELFYLLNRIIRDNFNMELYYKEKTDEFFQINDTENTKRNFEAIYKL